MMNKADFYYKKNLQLIKTIGSFDENPRPKYKDGTPAYSKFITSVCETYNLATGEFPIPTLRNTAIKTGIKEIFWIYQKQSNSLEVAHELGIKWWDDFNIGDNSIGNRYGYTVKKYNLMNNLLDSLKNDPFSRRHIINMYQYDDMNSSKGLNPCAYETLWSVRKSDEKYILDLTLIQRSNDYIMANSINKIQYVALQMMVASHVGYEIGTFTHFVQNLHVYDRHFNGLEELLNRESLEVQPSIKLKEDKNFYDFTIDDFIIEGVSDIKKIESPLEIAI